VDLTPEGPIARRRYDVLVAGARCAGASTAMLLARRGLRVLVVDPARRGSDTLSTHALMRGAVLQLHRWGLLEAIRASGPTPIRNTTFHYGDERVTIPIKERNGVDRLWAPRRTVLDPVLADAAVAAGAEVVHGQSVIELRQDPHGRVRGAVIRGADGVTVNVDADLVIGADGVRSRVAQLVEAPQDYTVAHTTASIYGYWRGLGLEGFQWFFDLGAGVGSIPTNAGETCVFVSIPQSRFENGRGGGLEPLYHAALREVSDELADRVAESDGPGKLRAFAGRPGFLRRATGPGWALVGDAGYFRDPITAHGISDALREAEFLAQAVSEGNDATLADYQEARDARVRSLLDITDRIASFEWELSDVKAYHLALNKAMIALVETQGALARD
jgi:2-polyprenyl-6-methoxyphenol hydroxylase-like FAD-dependent oxidoreductase